MATSTGRKPTTPRKRPVGKATSKPTGKLSVVKAPAKKTPGKAVAIIKDPKAKSEFTKAKATSITRKIGEGYQNTVKLVAEAYNGRIWLALGYKTWDEWREGEFGKGQYPLALPFVARRAAAAKLVETANMSTRAIAAVTGTSHETAAQDIKANAEADAQVSDNLTPDDGEPPLDVDVEPELDEDGNQLPPVPEEPRTVKGQDGKSYPVPTPSAPKPVVSNIVSDARSIGKDLEKVTYRLQALFDRDDYEENQVAVDQTLQQAIDDFADCAGPRLPQPVS